MNVSIINIGDELLIGQVVNTNAAVMSEMLIAAGMNVKETLVIGDDREAILSAVSRQMEVSDAVLVTGGLGPTKDDMTKKVLCELFDSKLVENEMALENVRRLFESRGYQLTPINRQQALVPECCEVLNNDLGTALVCGSILFPNNQTIRQNTNQYWFPFQVYLSRWNG
ncbi:MAG: competence/damage-inducible protein A [Bacteroidales bacterium]|nr:competence/damage-inducible protein A [Bacteroidales bacterium]